MRVTRRTRRLKERLRAATAGRLAQGEELLVVTYAQQGLPPPILRWAFGLLAIWGIALLFVDVPPPVVIASLCAFVLLLAYVLIGVNWLGVVLTDRRLLLWSTAPVTRQLRGVLLEVPLGHVWMQHTSVLRFDETVGHAPIRLIFRGQFMDDEPGLYRGMADASSEG